MEQGGFLYQAFVYLAAAVVAVPVAKKLGLGSVLGYLLAGVIIGPYIMGLVGQEGQDVMHFAEFGVVMMLFLVGLELQPSLLWKLRTSIVGMGGMQLIVTAILIFVIGLVANLSWQTAMALGLILALSSTAITLQTLNESGKMNTQGGQSSFSVLLFQDIAVIPILAILPFLAIETGVTHAPDAHGHGASTNWIEDFPVGIQALMIFGAIVFIIVTGKYLLTPCFRWIAKTEIRELFTAAALLLVIGIAILMTQVGLSPALGTFLAGVVLAQSEYRHELESDIEPFKGLLLGLFFIAVGASIDFQIIADSPGLIATLVGGLVVLKFVVLFVIGKVFKLGLDNNFLFAFGLAQGGEFAFVLFSFAIQNHVLSPDIANPLVVVVAMSMALTPLLMLINEKVLLPHFGTKEEVSRKADEIDHHSSVIIAGFGRYGSTVGRFLQANGIMATYLDLDPDNVNLLRKLGLKVFYGDASRPDLLHAAGAEKAKLLIVAVDSPEKTLEIIEAAKKHYPNLEILSRAQGWTDSYQIIEQGVEHVYRETFDSALRLAEDSMCKLGYRKFQTHRAIHKFRKHDERYLRELATIHEDEAALINETRLRIEDLENIMLKERTEDWKDKDLGWDPTTMREEFGPMQQREKQN